MSTGATNNRADREGPPAAAEPSDVPNPAQSTGLGGWSLRNLRVGRRLVALIAIPTVVALLLGGFRIWDNVNDWATHERIEGLATLGQSVTVLTHELGNERMLTATYIASNANPANRDQERQADLQQQQSRVDEARNDVRTQINELGDPGSDLASNKLSNMQAALDSLGPLREEVTDTPITVLPAVTKYRQLISALISFNEEIAEETDQTELRESVRALTSISGAREEISYESSLMLNALMRNSMSGGSQEAINSTRSRYENQLQNFMSTATVEERMIFDETYTGFEVSRMSTMRLRVLMRARTDQPLTGVTEGDTATDYQEVADESLSLLHSVEQQLAERVGDQAGALRDGAQVRALVESALVVLGIMIVFGLTTMVARSLVRPLRVLRDSALRVADRDLPEAIHRMRETDGAPTDVSIAPIGVDSRDEIGEVARSFDEVHQVALRLAADEASLRSNVNAMFVNLSRRSQTLVERQLRLIEGLEQGEQDSDRLGDLFQLDHLATRMRRNNENLLVLSGQENTRKWAQPVPLVDVLRGAISEVEHYERVNVSAPSQISVQGRPVNDIIHLVAELVENATTFSSHDTQVAVSARPLDGGDVLVEITDSGIGMAPEDLESINERLAEPPEVDVAVSRRMGLYVVSRLAARHGIQVRLQPARQGGTTAVMVMPATLLMAPGSTGPTSGFGAGSRVPDTYAEATAAFAASPAPQEPSDIWGPSAGQQQERPVWESSGPPEGLPKRPASPATGSAAAPPESPEHPPSGQDLWASANPSVRRRPGVDTGANRVVGPATSRPTSDTPPNEPSAPADPPPVEPLARPAQPSPPQPQQPTPPQQPAPPQQPVRPQQQPQQPPAPPMPAQPPAAAAPPPAPPAPPPVAPPPVELPAPQQPAEQTSIWNRPPAEANEPLTRSRMDPDPDRAGYGSTAYLARRPGEPGGHTVVPPPPPEDYGREALPIFDAVESNWFRRRTVRPVTAPDTTGPIATVGGNGSSNGAADHAPGDHGADANGHAAPEPEKQRPETVEASASNGSAWSSDSDVGWAAAETVSQPADGGLTRAGLPKRVPKANLVPGTAPAPERTRHLPARSADQVRNRLASLQDGIRQGRADTGQQSGRERQ